MSTIIKSQKSKAILNVYLVLKKDNQVLLSLRKNTGYFDNFYCFVAGHVEENESAIAALIREAKEEIDIEITPSNLKMKCAIHRKTDRNNVDFFFECTKWKGEIINNEPEKCGHLQFFNLDALPSNIIPFIAKVLTTSKEDFYLEEGW